jgi:chromosome segregation ATPase
MASTAGFNDDWEGNSLATKYDETMSSAQQRHRDELRRIERERKDLFEQQKQEVQTLRNEQQTVKDKFEQSKTRNTVLSNEIKTLREQLKTSLDKSKHDDELVDVLLKQQQQLKIKLENIQKDLDVKSKINTEFEQTQKLDQMKQANMIKQLQLIVDQKETKIRELEMHLDENRIEVRYSYSRYPSHCHRYGASSAGKVDF